MARDIGEWLDGLGLGRYAEALADNEIDLRALPHITEEDLKGIGVALGARRKLLAAIAELGESDEPATADESSDERSASAEAERRQVTVLFADLSGYTKLATEVDAEEAHAILGRFVDQADAVVRDYGGTVDKHIGDSVMAVFGAPVAHGDDSERAVRAALAIHEGMPALSGKVGRRLQVHIGVASGQVVASGVGGDAHYTVTGESVNLASRLTDAASPGETLISANVQRTVSQIVEWEDRGEIAVKGIAEPVRTYALRGLWSQDARRIERPFVGRRAELQQFTGVLAVCAETGVGQAVYVRGEAGIGKTRLVEEFERIARSHGFGRHRVLVLDFGVGKGKDAIRALVRSLLAIPSGSGQAERVTAAALALERGVLELDRAVHLNDLLDLPQPIEYRALYDAMDNATRNRGKRETVSALVRTLSGSRPLLLVVEDLHWADTLDLEYLAELTRTVAVCPAVLVMTSRIEGDPLDQAWRSSIAGTPFMTTDLGLLRKDEALSLAAEYIDATTQFARSCIKRADGNPLFLEQLLRSAEEAGEDQVPGSVQSIVQARLDTVEPLDKQAIQAASVLGQRFLLEALRHLIGSPQYTCAGLIEHYLVRPEGDDFLFAHALVQEGVYGSLLKGRRADLHRQAAAWYADHDPVLRAQHLDRSEDSTAPRAYLDAAQSQAAQYRYEPALKLAERGLDLASDRGDIFALTCFRGQMLHDLGSVTESIEAFENGLASADDDNEKCLAWVGMAAGMRIVDRYDDALKALDEAETRAEARALTAELSRIHFIRGNIYFPLGNIEGCLEQHELALGFAREASSPEGEARSLGGLADAHYMRGRMTSAHKQYCQCVEVSRQNGFGRIEVANRVMQGVTRIYQNELTTAIEECHAAAEAAAKVGDQRAELVARGGGLVFLLVETAEFDEARRQIEQGLALAGRLGARRFEPNCLLTLARILAHEDRRTEAVKTAEEAVSISRDTGFTFRGATALSVLASVADDPATRQRALEEGENVLRDGCVGHNYLWFYRDAMEICLELGDWDGVERYAAALADYTRPEPLPWTDFYIAKGRALSAHGRGKRDETTADELRRLHKEAEHVGLKLAAPALNVAINEA